VKFSLAEMLLIIPGYNDLHFIFMRIPNIKFHQTPFARHADGGTNMTDHFQE